MGFFKKLIQKEREFEQKVRVAKAKRDFDDFNRLKAESDRLKKQATIEEAKLLRAKRTARVKHDVEQRQQQVANIKKENARLRHERHSEAFDNFNKTVSGLFADKPKKRRKTTKRKTTRRRTARRKTTRRKPVRRKTTRRRRTRRKVGFE